MMLRGTRIVVLALTALLVGVVPIRAQPEPASPNAVPGTLSNISTRGKVGRDDSVMIVGFIVRDAPVRVLVRAIGPDLSRHGVRGVLANPQLRLFQGQTVIAENDNWVDLPQRAEIDTTGLAPASPLESALLLNLAPGAYTGIVSGVAGATGVALVEVFQIGGSGALSNISTRGQVGTSDEVMIGGFIVGDRPTTLVVRAIGPALADQGVAGALSDPTLRLYSDSSIISMSDNWVNSPNKAILESFRIAPSKSSESAIVVTLEPGPYTAIVSGLAGRTGVALVEVFWRSEVAESMSLPIDPTGGYACPNYLPNGDFERGGSEWLAMLEVAGSRRQIDAAEIVKNSTYSAKSGQWYGHFGGRNDVLHGLVSTLAIETRQPDQRLPGDLIGASLRFDMRMSTWEDPTDDYDGFGLLFASADRGSNAVEEVAFFTNVDAFSIGNNWRHYEYDITRHVVQRSNWISGVIFTMIALTDYSSPTTWDVDNVSFLVCYRDTSGNIVVNSMPLGTVDDLPDVTIDLDRLENFVAAKLNGGQHQK